MNVWRVNVQQTRIDSCIQHKKFTIDRRPKGPPIEKGDVLLLQLVLTDARRHY